MRKVHKIPKPIINENSIKKDDEKKMPIWLDEYINHRNHEKKIVTKNFLEEYAANMIKETYDNPNYITVEDLYMELGIPEGTYYKWIERYPFFREAHEYACRNLGRKREKKGLVREWDTLGSMYQYSPRWQKGEEWRSSLRQKENKAKGDITVILEKFSESESVPLKKSPEEVAESVRKQTQSAQPIGKVRI